MMTIEEANMFGSSFKAIPLVKINEKKPEYNEKKG